MAKGKKNFPFKMATKIPIAAFLALWLLPLCASVFFTACRNPDPNFTSQNDSDLKSAFRNNPNPEAPTQNILCKNSMLKAPSPENVSPFHSVPYFHDDTGKSIQTRDGFLYGYWNGLLCRYSLDTLHQEVYFRADSNQSGRFCIYEDAIYFLERPLTASLTGMDTCLYMADLDGHGRKLLTTQIPNTTKEYSSYNNYTDYYEIDIYDDIIYLLSNNHRENVYYRLDKKLGSVTPIEESETLYGRLPEGYKEPFRYSHIPSLPYQMRHYGYLILMDESGNLAAYDGESGNLERIGLPTESIARNSVFLTNNALYYAEETDSGQPFATWYRISLDNLNQPEEWGQFFSMQRLTGDDIFYDESGAYFAKKEGAVVNLFQIPWDGSTVRFLYGQYLSGGEYFLSPAFGDQYLCYTDGNYFYFNDHEDSQYYILRKSLYGTSPQPETVMVYHEDSTEAVCTYDTWQHSFTVKTTVEREACSFTFHTSLTKAFLAEDILTENRDGAHAINMYLNSVYQDILQELDAFEQSYHGSDNPLPLPDGLGSYMRVTAYPNYLDESYLGITIAEEIYFSGGAHPNTTSDEFVFDLRTGKRIAVTDIVENTPEEIREIAAAYIDIDHPEMHFADNPEMRESILEDFRFFLAQEGIGFHFDTYELGSYAEGNEDYIIPFWEFELKDDTINYINIEKVHYRYEDSRLELGEIPPYAKELAAVLEEQLSAEQSKEGALPAFFHEHASDCRELSFEEIRELIAADQQGVLKQYYISAKKPEDKWLYFDKSQGIWIQQSYLYEGVRYWVYYHFPHGQTGYSAALDAASSNEEYYFLAWEDIDYLITVDRDSNGRITGLSTHCLLDDTIYNGWILRQTLKDDGEVTTTCLFYWI